MSLHPTMRRRIHERLHPLIGDEETDALLDAIPDDPVTREWLETRFDRIDDRFERIDERFERIDDRFERIDERFDRVDERFARVDDRFERLIERSYSKEALDSKLETMEHRIMGNMHGALKQQIVWVYGAAAACAVIISIVDRIWGG